MNCNFFVPAAKFQQENGLEIRLSTTEYKQGNNFLLISGLDLGPEDKKTRSSV